MTENKRNRLLFVALAFFVSGLSGCGSGANGEPANKATAAVETFLDAWSRGETLNLTWQATPKNKVTFFSHFNQRLVDCNNCSALTSPEVRAAMKEAGVKLVSFPQLE